MRGVSPVIEQAASCARNAVATLTSSRLTRCTDWTLLRQLKPHVNDAGFALHTRIISAFFKHFQHRKIFRQDLGDEFRQSGIARNHAEMTHQCCADALVLTLIDYRKGELGLSGFGYNVACASDDCRLTAFVYHRHQRHMIDEVDVEKECDFRLGKVALHPEETAVERRGSDAFDGSEEFVSVLRPQCADFHSTAIAQRLDTRIVGCI